MATDWRPIGSSHAAALSWVVDDTPPGPVDLMLALVLNICPECGAGFLVEGEQTTKHLPGGETVGRTESVCKNGHKTTGGFYNSPNGRLP